MQARTECDETETPKASIRRRLGKECGYPLPGRLEGQRYSVVSPHGVRGGDPVENENEFIA